MSDMKLSLDEIRGLMESFSSSGLTSFTLRDGDFELSFASEKPEQVYVCPPTAAPVAPGAVCSLSLPENKGRIAYFAGIDKAKFRNKAVPGDTLTLEVEVIKVRGPLAVCKAVATVDGRKIVTAELTSMLGDAPAPEKE